MGVGQVLKRVLGLVGWDFSQTFSGSKVRFLILFREFIGILWTKNYSVHGKIGSEITGFFTETRGVYCGWEVVRKRSLVL